MSYFENTNLLSEAPAVQKLGSAIHQVPVVQASDSAIQGKITIQRKRIWETNCVIHWVEIYPMDSTIHLLNNLPLITYYPSALYSGIVFIRWIAFEQLGPGA